MKYFTALLLPLLASAAMLPETIGSAKRIATGQPNLEDRQIWDELGLRAAENGVFEGEDGKFTVTLCRLQDPTGALGAFQWQRPAKGQATSRYGNYVIAFSGHKPTEEELNGLQKSLLNVDNSALPVLSTYLPAEGLQPNSERYVTGPAALQKFFPAVPPSVAAFNYGTEAQIGTYRKGKSELVVGIFNYPTHQIAMQRVAEFEKTPGAVVKRTGPMIAVVVNPADADFAQQVLSQIRYQAEITESEYVPTQRDNPGDLLYNAFLLTGILLALAIVSGLFFGGIRTARRRYGKTGDENAVISLHLKQ
jgi:hypothetical protein